jgi:hypothetical protein
MPFGCGFDEIFWAGLAETPNGSKSAGLTVYFKRMRFVGYAYGPPYGGPNAPAVRDGLMLSTAAGSGSTSRSVVSGGCPGEHSS